jgi:hypothetical protein
MTTRGGHGLELDEIRKCRREARADLVLRQREERFLKIPVKGPSRFSMNKGAVPREARGSKAAKSARTGGRARRPRWP